MKKIYLLIILLVSGFGFAQATYTIEFKNLNYKVTRNVKNKTSSHFNLSLVYSDGTSAKLYGADIGDDSSVSNYSINSFPTSKIPKSIYYDLFVNFSSTGNIDQYFNISVYPCITANTYSAEYNGMTVSFDYDVRPNLKIIQPELGVSNFLPVDENVIISSTTGFISDYYNWEYSVNDDPTDPLGWKALPQYAGKSSFTSNATAILGTDASSYHGRKIFFRQRACNTKSEVVEYAIRLSTPNIVSISKEDVSCYDLGSQDGKLKIQFGRPLHANENLSIDLFFNNSNINKEHISLNSDNTYVVDNLLRGGYELKLIGNLGFGTLNSYSPTATNPLKFEIEAPKPLSFTLESSNILCYGAQNGTIAITPTGGTRNIPDNDYYSLDGGTTWVPFSNQKPHTINNLLPGTYNVIIKDMNGCIASEQKMIDGIIELGNTKVLTQIITEPAPVSLSFTSIQEPAFFGGSNGKITVSITGGTPFNDNSYLYEWRNSKNEIISNTKTTTEFAGDLYAITLNDIPADTYTLSVWDANYNLATSNAGCTILPVISIVLTQPDPIVVTFEIKQTISCNVSNEFGNESDLNPTDGQRDESQDGILVAHVAGGVPFKGFENNRMPYKYFWKKQQTDGTWISLDDKTETAQNLRHGNYALNVEDKNGIKLGVYVNNILERETDSIQFMQQPSRLELELIKEDILCSQGNNGQAKANVTGGTPPYVYQWTNGKTTDTITQLTSGNYFVKVTDAKGCTVQGSILIEQPNGVVINETITNPTCFQGNDGLIHLAPTGGVTPYQYSWSTGANTRDISNLAEGNYTVTLTDAQGCIMIQNFEVTAPDPVVIDLGADRTLCLDQVLELNASIPDAKAQYEWTATNGFTSDKPEVSLTKAGTYHVKVTSGFGCTGEDEIVVKTNETVIDSEFLLSSQAYLDEEVILVNTSNPFGETTKWMIPQNVIILEEKEKYITLQFKDLGTYTISLQQTQGECYAVYTKNITVEKRGILPNTGGATSSFIKDFMVTPNPSDGNFKAAINLENDSPVNLRLFSSNGQYSAIEKKEAGKKNYEIDFNVTLASGIYILVLETAHQTLVKKIIIY